MIEKQELWSRQEHTGAQLFSSPSLQILTWQLKATFPVLLNLKAKTGKTAAATSPPVNGCVILVKVCPLGSTMIAAPASVGHLLIRDTQSISTNFEIKENCESCNLKGTFFIVHGLHFKHTSYTFKGLVHCTYTVNASLRILPPF